MPFDPYALLLDAVVEHGRAGGVAGQPDAHLVVEQAVGRADPGRALGDEHPGAVVEVDQVPGRRDRAGAGGDPQAVGPVGGEAVGVGGDRPGAAVDVQADVVPWTTLPVRRRRRELLTSIPDSLLSWTSLPLRVASLEPSNTTMPCPALA